LAKIKLLRETVKNESERGVKTLLSGNEKYDDQFIGTGTKQGRHMVLTHQVPTGLLRPRIIGNFQRFFKYSKYGPISEIFFFKSSQIYQIFTPREESRSNEQAGGVS
jgi:hypothetical protein